MLTVRTAELSWRALERHRDAGSVVLIPMGSTEEHGPHNATGDYLVTDAIAERAAVKARALMTPTIPFSYSEYFRTYPGTITVQGDTLRFLVRDVATSLIEQGFKKLILLNGHKGNEPILQLLIRELRRDYGLLLPVIPALTFGRTANLMNELYGDQSVGHGGDPMGSLQSYLHPELVDVDAAEEFGPQPFWGQPSDGPGGIVFNGQRVMLALNMEDVTPPSGSLSDPRLASAERGERLIKTSVEAITEFIEWFKTVDPYLPVGQSTRQN